MSVDAARLAKYGLDAAALEVLRRDAERRGHALDRGGVVRERSAAGLPVRPKRRLFAALAVGAIDARMGEAQLAGLVLPPLLREARALAARLAAPEEAAWRRPTMTSSGGSGSSRRWSGSTHRGGGPHRAGA